MPFDVIIQSAAYPENLTFSIVEQEMKTDIERL